MNVYRSISSKIVKENKGNFSSIAIKIATASVAIGISILILSFAILKGFEREIVHKIFSFGSHFIVSKYEVSNSYEDSPITTNSPLIHNYKQLEGIEYVQTYATKAGLIKTGNDVEGAIFKGLGHEYNMEAFASNLVAGDLPEFSDTAISKEIAMSRKMADKLNLDVDSSIIMYFIQNPPKYRKLTISGIYETGLEDFDDLILIGDIKMVQQLNKWPDTLVGGYEVKLENFEQMEVVLPQLLYMINHDMGVERITDKYIQLFDWISLLNQNVNIFIWILLIVAIFNMISTIFVMSMERINMIGILKAIGAKRSQIRKVFWFIGVRIIFNGLLWGNSISLIICGIQYYFKLIPLNKTNYYMEFVPISWEFGKFLQMNLLLLSVLSAVIYLPVYVISNYKPMKSIKFD